MFARGHSMLFPVLLTISLLGLLLEGMEFTSRPPLVAIEPTYDPEMFIVGQDAGDFQIYGIVISIDLARNLFDDTEVKDGFIYEFPSKRSFDLISSTSSVSILIDKIFIDGSLEGTILQLPCLDQETLNQLDDTVNVKFTDEQLPPVISHYYRHQGSYELAEISLLDKSVDGPSYFLKNLVNLGDLSILNRDQASKLYFIAKEFIQTDGLYLRLWKEATFAIVFQRVSSEAKKYQLKMPQILTIAFDTLLRKNQEAVPVHEVNIIMKRIVDRFRLANVFSRFMNTEAYLRLIVKLVEFAITDDIRWAQVEEYMDSFVDHLLRKDEKTIKGDNFEAFKMGFIDASSWRLAKPSKSYKIGEQDYGTIDRVPAHIKNERAKSYMEGYGRRKSLISTDDKALMMKCVHRVAKKLDKIGDTTMGYIENPFVMFFRLTSQCWPFLFFDSGQAWSEQVCLTKAKYQVSFSHQMLRLIELYQLMQYRSDGQFIMKAGRAFASLQKILQDQSDVLPFFIALEAIIQICRYDTNPSELIDEGIRSLSDARPEDVHDHVLDKLLFFASYDLPRLFRIVLKAQKIKRLLSIEANRISFCLVAARRSPHCFMYLLAELKPSLKCLQKLRSFLVEHICILDGAEGCTKDGDCIDRTRELYSVTILDILTELLASPDGTWNFPAYLYSENDDLTNFQQNIAIQAFLLLRYGIGIDETGMIELHDSELWDGPREIATAAQFLLDRFLHIHPNRVLNQELKISTSQTDT